MYVLDKPSKLEGYLHLVEFAYNNGQKTSMNMSPFEMLYGRKCQAPVNWDNPMSRIMLGPEMLQEMEKEVTKIQQQLKLTQDKKKIYANLKRLHKEFKVDDHVYLRVKPRKRSSKLGSYAKLAP